MLHRNISGNGIEMSENQDTLVNDRHVRQSTMLCKDTKDIVSRQPRSRQPVIGFSQKADDRMHSPTNGPDNFRTCRRRFCMATAVAKETVDAEWLNANRMTPAAFTLHPCLLIYSVS